MKKKKIERKCRHESYRTVREPAIAITQECLSCGEILLEEFIKKSEFD